MLRLVYSEAERTVVSESSERIASAPRHIEVYLADELYNNVTLTFYWRRQPTSYTISMASLSGLVKDTVYPKEEEHE